MDIQRMFIPGSEWFYLKLYTGPKSADCILTDYLHPMMLQLMQRTEIKEYFFIRYNDPDFHIRFRLKVPDVQNYGTVFEHICQYLTPCVQNGLIWNITCDSYRRELERYGESIIEWVEHIFCADSLFIIRLLQELGASLQPDQERWLISLKVLDDLLNIFGYDLEEKKRLLELRQMAFKNEFGFFNHQEKKQLDDKYRKYRQLIENTLDENSSIMRSYESLLKQRIVNMTPFVASILSEKEILKDELLADLMHMSMNRMFRSENRLHELVIYDLLSRYYESKWARLKKTLK